jgi:8-oxo-dGTP pyrophosphatase MutT (NUDIX family)
MPREKSAGAIIFRKDSGNIYYLLLHYGPGHWGFAKGHVEGNETEEETTRREVAEETGIKDLKIIPGFKKIEKYFFKRSYGLKGEARKKAPWVFKLVAFFVAETKTKDIKISHEHTGFLWLPINEAIKKTTFKNSKRLLKEANDFILQK